MRVRDQSPTHTTNERDRDREISTHKKMHTIELKYFDRQICYKLVTID